MSHSSTEPIHTLCSHDVSDCPFKKGGKNPKQPPRRHCFFFGTGKSHNSKFIFCHPISFLLLKGVALCVHIYFSQATSKEPLPEFPHWRYYSGPRTVTFFHRPSISYYDDVLNANFTVPKHFSCTFTASYQHTVTFHGTCSASPGKGYEPTARELCWYTSTAPKIWEEGSLKSHSPEQLLSNRQTTLKQNSGKRKQTKKYLSLKLYKKQHFN